MKKIRVKYTGACVTVRPDTEFGEVTFQDDIDLDVEDGVYSILMSDDSELGIEDVEVWESLESAVKGCARLRNIRFVRIEDII